MNLLRDGKEIPKQYMRLTTSRPGCHPSLREDAKIRLEPSPRKHCEPCFETIGTLTMNEVDQCLDKIETAAGGCIAMLEHISDGTAPELVLAVGPGSASVDLNTWLEWLVSQVPTEAVNVMTG